MSDAFDVVVVGGGPAGYSAALAAAAAGARVAVVEAEALGGTCVHHACIPTNALLGAATTHLEARELALLGVADVGDELRLGRAVARKDALVRQLASGIAAALRLRRVELVRGRATLDGPGAVVVEGSRTLDAGAVVVATGARFEPPAIPGVAPGRVLTADLVQSLPTAPASALVVGGGPAAADYGVEYAFLLAAAGARVTFATPHPRLLPALDADLDEAATAALTTYGVEVLLGAAVERGEGAEAVVAHPGGTTTAEAEVVVVADRRVPLVGGLGLEEAGVVVAGGAIAVDRACRTGAASVYAAGDVTGGWMLTNAAQHMGEVAGANATATALGRTSRGAASTRLSAVPHLLHTLPEVGWVGLSAARAAEAGHDVAAGAFELAYNARAVALGAREGLVKVVADRDTGEVLGVHAVGPEASEILALATLAVGAELTVDDLAASVQWHPSVAEGLVEAARRVV